jgi:LemA protein
MAASTVGCSSSDGRELPPPKVAQTTTPSAPVIQPPVGSGEVFTLSSSSFSDGTEIPVRFTCRGDQLSPALEWSGVPLDTSSLALVVRDLNAGGFVHWVVTHIDPFVQSVGENGLPEDALEGRNSGGSSGWTSPCPPAGSGVHTYEFSLLALVDPVTVPLDAPAEQIAAALESAAVERAVLTARFRPRERIGAGTTLPRVRLAGLLAGAVVLLLLAGVISYNRFVRQRQLIDNAWSNIDTELRRRYDLIPNLVRTVQGYAAHERATLTAVVEARNAAVASVGDVTAQEGPEQVLVHSLRSMLAVSESYPALQADQHFLELQAELAVTEDRIQAARRLFNGNVRDYNQRVDSVPSNVIAAWAASAARVLRPRAGDP